MVCAWEAVSRLDEVCARAFVATPPDDGDSRNANNTYWRDYPGRELDLFACDEHAFCHACAAGNAYCEAVAYHYGGVGVPLRISAPQRRLPHTQLRSHFNPSSLTSK